VIKSLVKKFEFSNLILEKFLFQRIDDYETIGELLSNRKINTYVNCPRRLNPCYAEIKKLIQDKQDVNIRVVGNNWGIGSNSIHFVDLFQWLTGKEISSWTNKLDAGYVQSKRQGYVEFFGSIEGLIDDKSVLTLTSIDSKVPELELIIQFDNRTLVVDEINSEVYEDLGKEERMDMKFGFQTLYQSNLSNVVAEQIFRQNRCDLTLYDDSVKSHLPFFKTMLEHYNRHSPTKSQNLPIT
jgi:predicted dehydrogenase